MNDLISSGGGLMKEVLRKFSFIHYGVFVTVVMSLIFGYNLLSGDKSLYLPGETTHGHHQIELQCTACHVEAFESGEMMQKACESCHSESLKKARDTHPKSKFTDPRNADKLANLNATECVTCHAEHSPEITSAYGVTLPKDFCFYCHQDIAEERPSHKDFEFDSCTNSGCHGYHDNKALYEKFLAKHLDESSMLAKTLLKKPNGFDLWQKKHNKKKSAQRLTALSANEHDGDNIELLNAESKRDIAEDWAVSAHARAQVNCSGCHASENWETGELKVAHDDATGLAVAACVSCHERQSKSFTEGLHGMRLGLGMPPMQVSGARRAMHAEAKHRTLTCSSCHDPHNPDLKAAAVDACLGCHDDEHSRNYQASSHAELWRKEVAGEGEAGSGVSCASCHMPRIKKGRSVAVEHNQSLTLAPNNKMLRPVCGNCHGLEYSVSALADRALIKQNFSGDFDASHPSFDLVRRRIAERKAKKRKP